MRSENQAHQLIREQAARAVETAPVRLAFLGDVSTALATSLEYEATLEKLPPLAVPFPADWCVNEALAAINGLPIEDHQGRTPLDLNPQLMSILEPLRRQALDAGEPVVNAEVSAKISGAPGERRHWLVSYYPV
jgi:PAS domain-containing protein